ncbi:V-type ATP synthase subunit D [Planosporangium sp. 12N6]|uniref:V-type ATP synthase subunit D n=1 Tax=Planosporangium spinosum TaxID=3402278 RepID=UPI003CEDC992
MPDLRRVPPGRAGRLWLRRRLDTAERGVRLLDRKLRILRTEQERLRQVAEQTGVAWQARCREAERWLARAAMLGGQREIRLATGAPTAEVTVEWGSVMGARYPLEATCRPTGGQRVPGTVALDQAIAAHRAALQAAVAHAAATESCRVIDAEVAETRRRVRALGDRWIPRLTEALAALDQRLEETERAEQIRMRWAAER